MFFKRILALASAVVLTAGYVGSLPAASAEINADLADFSEKWADKFFDDDTTEVTENTYKSHDLNIRIDRHEMKTLSGDADENGHVRIADAILIMRYLSEDKVGITVDGLRNADIDQDGMVTSTDVIKILEWLSGETDDSEFFVEHNLVWFVIDFYVRNLNCLRGAFAKGTYPVNNKQVDSIEDMANQNNAMFAINCDYCGFRTNGVIIRNGVTYQTAHRTDVCLLYKNGVMDIVPHNIYVAMSDEEKANIWQSVSFSPPLVQDGEVCPITQTGNILNPHPRSGIGYFEPGHYCFIQVEGRQPGYSDGILLPDYARMFQDLGCVEAYNMDGGSSSVIVFNGKQINKPAWSGRETSDILYLVDTANIPEDTAAKEWLKTHSPE